MGRGGSWCGRGQLCGGAGSDGRRGGAKGRGWVMQGGVGWAMGRGLSPAVLVDTLRSLSF